MKSVSEPLFTATEWFVGLSLAMLVRVMLGMAIMDEIYRTDSIQHHVAHYDVTTGKWKWNQ